MPSGCTLGAMRHSPYLVVGRIRSMAIITVEEWQPGSLHGWPLPSS